MINRESILSRTHYGTNIYSHILRQFYPGESVMYEDGKLYINGKYIEDSYSLSSTKDFDNIVLKEDEYFVLGDNREVSKDSRMIGPVKKEQILGKTRLVIFPFTKIRMEK